MQKSIIIEKDVEDAIDWLKSNENKCAEYRANRRYLEDFSKSLKAILMKEFQDLPISAQEREAYSHKNYQEHLKALRQAVFLDEKFRFKAKTQETIIEAWRTQEANLRSVKI